MQSVNSRSGVLRVGEKIQFTDRKGKRITAQLIAGGFTQTEHGLICHDDVIGQSEGVVITTVSAKRESQQNSENQESKDLSKSGNKPWKAARAIGG